MGIFGKLKSTTSQGIGNGYIPGQIAVWGTTGEAELLRIVLTVIDPKEQRLPKFSYSFIPSHRGSYHQSLAVPQVILEIIRGREIKEGHTFEFEFLTHGKNPVLEVLAQDEFEKAVHGKSRSKGPKITVCKTVEPDSSEFASLDLSEIKTRSDAWRTAEDERKRIETERLAKEAAEKEAKLKAEAAKAVQATAPAARAATSGDPKATTLPPCKTIIVYGSSTGNTKNIAEMLRDALNNVDHVKNVTEITPADFTVPENLILGIPTWHIGELQDDWAAMLPLLEQVNPNVSGKKVAIFGLGDQKGYPDTYVDAIQMLWEPLQKRGAKLFGLWPTKGYEFKKSKAIQDGKFMGLVIDIENQDHLSEERVKVWANQIKGEMGL